jgi:hypothetical protein
VSYPGVQFGSDSLGLLLLTGADDYLVFSRLRPAQGQAGSFVSGTADDGNLFGHMERLLEYLSQAEIRVSG